MTLEQRVEYLEMRDKNTRMIIDSLSDLVHTLSEGIELLSVELERSRESIIATAAKEKGCETYQQN